MKCWMYRARLRGEDGVRGRLLLRQEGDGVRIRVRLRNLPKTQRLELSVPSVLSPLLPFLFAERGRVRCEFYCDCAVVDRLHGCTAFVTCRETLTDSIWHRVVASGKMKKAFTITL